MAVGQTLPHSIEAEKAVLGAVLSDADSLMLVEGMLEPRHFFLESHFKIFESILELSAAGESADIVTVAEKLRQNKVRDLGPAYLIDLTENCPVAQNLEHYSRLIPRQIVGSED